MTSWADQLRRLRSDAPASTQHDLWLMLTAAGLDESSLDAARAGAVRAQEHFGSLHGKRLVDLGCGIGRHLFWLADAGAGETVGIDASMSLLQHAAVLAPSATLRCADFRDIGELGAFDLVCSFSHSIFLVDSVEGFAANLRAIRGAMNDYGLLWIEQRLVPEADLVWTLGGVEIHERTERVDVELMRHRWRIDGRTTETRSVRLDAARLGELAEDAGFLLEESVDVIDDGERITCYALRAQQGFNFLSDMAEFLASWADPSHWRNGFSVEWDDFDASRRKPVGPYGLRQGASLSRHHPEFRDAIEPGIRPLALEIVEGWDFVTYSSCEGHLIASGPPEVFSEAYCGIVSFANRQTAVIQRLVQHATASLELEHVRPRVRIRNLYGPTTSHLAVDVMFDRRDRTTTWLNYRTDVVRGVVAVADAFEEIRTGDVA